MEDQGRPARAAAVAVVELPAEIDIANAAQVRGQLAAALASGAAVVIADMTGTTFTDTLGARALVLAQKQAAARGAELRVVLAAKPVLRVLSILGVDRYLSIYPSLSAARGAGAARPRIAAGVIALTPPWLARPPPAPAFSPTASHGAHPDGRRRPATLRHAHVWTSKPRGHLFGLGCLHRMSGIISRLLGGSWWGLRDLIAVFCRAGVAPVGEDGHDDSSRNRPAQSRQATQTVLSSTQIL